MLPKEYYYNQFRNHFQEFWNNVPYSEAFRWASLHKSNDAEILSHIPKEDLSYFLSSLACTILIDQVIYTYFPVDYPAFNETTKYPKMTTAWINANPWMVFDQKIILPRSLHTNQVLEKFKEFAEFFIEDLEIFFKENKFKEATWKKVQKVMLDDPDVAIGRFGKLFIKELKR